MVSSKMLHFWMDSVSLMDKKKTIYQMNKCKSKKKKKESSLILKIYEYIIQNEQYVLNGYK